MQTKFFQAPVTSDIMKLGFGKRNINFKKKLDHYLTGVHAVSELFWTELKIRRYLICFLAILA